MCGAGTILAEQLALGRFDVVGGDLEIAALRAAGLNLRRVGAAHLARWDASCLPLAEQSIDRIVSNPPFGKQLSRPEEIRPLYRRMVVEYDRVLRPTGRAVLLVSDAAALREAAKQVSWKRLREVRVRVLGQPAALTVWQKVGGER
jgi:tRNA G10  N-methylase Trm11